MRAAKSELDPAPRGAAPTSGEGHPGRQFSLTIALVALAIRLGYILVSHAHPDLMTGLSLDAEHFARIAQGLRSGAGSDGGAHLVPPLYPHFLSLFPGIERDPTNNPVIAIRLAQAALGAVNCVLLAHLAYGLGGARTGRAAAWIAGLGAALYGPLVHYETTVGVAGPLGLALTAAALLGMSADRRARSQERPQLLRWLACGLCLGVAIALRPLALVVLILLAAYLALGSLARAGSTSRLARCAALAALVLGGLAPVLPFTLQNLAAGERVLLSADGGMNFWIGNHRGASGLFEAPEGYDALTDPAALQDVERELGRQPTYSEAAHLWRSRALADIAADPGEWLALLGTKVLLYMHPSEIPQQDGSFAYHREHAWPLRIGSLPPLDARWILLLALAAPAVLALGGGRAALLRARVPLVIAAAFSLGVCLLFVNARYRIPIMPIAIALAATASAGLWEQLRRRERGRRPALLALCAVLLATLTGSYPFFSAGLPVRVAQYSAAEERQLGMDQLRVGRFAEAAELLRSALERDQDPKTRMHLAQALESLGLHAEAAAHYRRVLAQQPENLSALVNLGNLCWEFLADPETALELLERAILIDPRNGASQYRTAMILMERGDFAEAGERFEVALQSSRSAAPWRAHAEEQLIAARRAAYRKAHGR